LCIIHTEIEVAIINSSGALSSVAMEIVTNLSKVLDASILSIKIPRRLEKGISTFLRHVVN